MEAPATSPARRRLGVLRGVAIVGLLVAITFGAWWLWGRHVPLKPQVQTVGVEGRSPADPLVLAELGGTEQQRRLTTFAGVEAMDMLTAEEVAVYRGGGASMAKVKVAEFSDGKAVVAVVRMSGGPAARAAAQRLTELQLGYGFQALSNSPPGVHATVFRPGDAEPEALPGGRAHYVRGEVLVRVEVRGPDVEPALARFADALATQLQTLPSDG